MRTFSEFQLAVIGGGIAGLVAANCARQRGVSAVVLEKGQDALYRCNTRFSSGTLHVALNDIMSGEDKLYAAIMNATDGTADRELARTLAANAARTVRWLQDAGMKFVRTGTSLHQNWVFAPPRRRRPGLDWEGRSGDVLLKTLEASLLERGGVLKRGSKATHLLAKGRRVCGVEVETVDGPVAYECRAVLIADGGFQGNTEMVGRYISPNPLKLMQRGAGTGCGDGIRMAEEVEAAIVGTRNFYGHILSRDALSKDGLWPYPYFDAIAAAAIIVDGTGRRFVDEGQSGVHSTNAIARLADPLSASVVFDKRIWDTVGTQGLVPANPFIEREGGTIQRAATLADLAGKLGIDADALTSTVAAYNDAARSNDFSSLSPARNTSKVMPMPIVGPYFGAPLCAGLTYTMGGLSTDGDGRVLRADRSPIEGLFAAGATTGGLEGGPHAGYVGGLAKSAVFGAKAAEAVAADSIQVQDGRARETGVFQ